MLIKLLIFILLISCIIDPANKIFKIKETMFFVIFVLSFSNIFLKNINFKKNELYYIFIILLLIILGFLNGLIRNINYNNLFALQYVKSFLFISLLIVLYQYSELFEKYFIFILNIMAYFIIILFVMSLIIPNIELAIAKYLTFEVESAKIGYRKYGQIILPMIYLKTSPLLLFSVTYFLKKHNILYFFNAIICLIAIILSGTRANIIIGIMLFFIVLYIEYKKSRWLTIFIFVILILSMLPIVLDSFFNKDEFSNYVKINHILKYFELFDLKTILLGQGIGSGFYSNIYFSIIYNTELTYLELIRIFGLPIAVIILFIISLPAIRYYKFIGLSMFLTYVMYLIIAGTNPLLISSTGMISIIYIFINYYNNKKAKKYE